MAENNEKKLKCKKEVDSFIISDSLVEESHSPFYEKLTNHIKTNKKSLMEEHTFHSEYDRLFTPLLRKKKKLTFDDSDKENDNTLCKDDSKIINKSKFVLLHDSASIDQRDALIEINRSRSADIIEIKSQTPKHALLTDSDTTNSSDSSFMENVKEGSSEITEKVFVPKKTVSVPQESSSSSEFEDIIGKSSEINNSLGPKYHSFLKSLSQVTDSSLEIHPEAVKYKIKYKTLKEELALTLFKLYNREVFKNQLPPFLAIEWNTRLRTSSGNCQNNGFPISITDGYQNILKVSKISLSTKILVTPERLRDVLIHELCHAASWLLGGNDRGHGPGWKSWTEKAMRAFPELPKIERCHHYSVDTKYKYRCVGCGYSIGRHSKLRYLQNRQCNRCDAKFERILSKPRQLPKFALFVKENYGNVKKENSTLKHGEIMKLLGVKFAADKNKV